MPPRGMSQNRCTEASTRWFFTREKYNISVTRFFGWRDGALLSFFLRTTIFSRSAVNLSTMDRLMPQWDRDLKVRGKAWKKKSGLFGILAGDDKWSAHQPENASVLANSADWIKPLSITLTRAPSSATWCHSNSCVGPLNAPHEKRSFPR